MTNRSDYFRQKAALLDPDTYEYIFASGWSRTVPPGCTWYALNLWYVNINGQGPYFHRHLDVDRAVRLAAGTTIGVPYGSRQEGFAYICKPELAPPDSDPEDTYYRRMVALGTIPQFLTVSSVPAGSKNGYYTGALFDNDFTDGIFNHVMSENLCWTILVGSSSRFNALNMQDEINDSHEIRLAGNILCPFKRADWNGIWTEAGSRSGDYTAPSEEVGVGAVIYQKLPAIW